MNDFSNTSGLVTRVWFRPLVAIWFGLLAAAGMWFMPPSVHSGLARMLGLSGLHPIFAFPVSGAGVLAFCAAAFIVGALIGLFIASRIARTSRPRAFAPGFEIQDESVWLGDEAGEAGDAPMDEPRRRRVFSAREDIGETGIEPGAPGADDGYDAEYETAELPPVSPEEAFDALYAELEDDFVAAEYTGEEELVPQEREDEACDEDDVAVAAIRNQVEPEPEMEPEPEPIPELEPEDLSVEDTELSLDHEGAEDEAAIARPQTALGDLSLDDLVGRLEGALAHHRAIVAGSEAAAQQPPPQVEPLQMRTHAEDRPPATTAGDQSGEEDGDGDDPMIAFLRREASKRMPPPATGEDLAPEDAVAESSHDQPAPLPRSQPDAQDALRNALDRLGQARRRD